VSDGSGPCRHHAHRGHHGALGRLSRNAARRRPPGAARDAGRATATDLSPDYRRHLGVRGNPGLPAHEPPPHAPLALGGNDISRCPPRSNARQHPASSHSQRWEDPALWLTLAPVRTAAQGRRRCAVRPARVDHSSPLA
jgi:hypothetical protein